MSTAQASTRRGELLAAARRVVERDGFAGATVGEITREAGASLGLLHYHFESRDEVVAEVFAQLARDDLATLRALDGGGLDARGRLRAWLAVNDPADRESWRLWVDAWGESLHAEAMARILEAFRREWSAALRRTIELGVREGAWTCADAEATAGVITAAVDGVGLTATVHPDALSPAAARVWMTAIVERHLDGHLDAAPAAPDAAAARGVAASAPPASSADRAPVLRSGDVDAAGRVRGPVLLALLDDARDAALGDLPGADGATVLHVELEHHRPARAADAPLRATAVVHREGAAALRCVARLGAHDGTVLATAHTRMAA